MVDEREDEQAVDDRGGPGVAQGREDFGGGDRDGVEGQRAAVAVALRVRARERPWTQGLALAAISR